MRASMLAAAAAIFLSFPALAAIPGDAATNPLAAKDAYPLNTVQVVHNWVLCVSQAAAESLVHAREESVEAAQKAYAALSAAKSCGQFPKLGVQLRAPLYRSAPGIGIDARAFGALVNIGVGWQQGFVVVGSLPEE